MSEEIKRTIILENYQNPKNRGLIEDDSYEKKNTNSESCIDQIDLQIKVENDKVKDIRFDGEACAICTSSTSILINTLIGKTTEEALEIIHNFQNMIDEKEYNKKLLGDAVVYSDISKQPNRKKCALLTWEGTKEVLERR
ncbi:MAG: SUF system NifU family Fe-S cluster assembly protein [Bacilli bacterium]|nr:SUF system NifU family Fe-S cluster assembly protein [Bacilli bacterium]